MVAAFITALAGPDLGPDEAALLRTQKYRQQIAEALFAGVMKYQQSLKKPLLATE